MIQLPALIDLDTGDDDAGFGALQTPRGNLPLSAVDVRTRIDGLIARTQVRQTFVNAFAEPLEATYIFPLPDRAAVGRFRLQVAGRVVEGQLQERGQARQTYDRAMQAGHRAAIAEEERPNVFTMRVGNLPPGESATVELTLTGPLPVDNGEATFRFPLVVAPRYIPGTPLPGESVGDGTEPDTDAVPDASRITPPVLLPGQPNPVRLSLSVEVHPGGLNARDFRSSLHTVQEDHTGAGWRFRVQPGERLDRDFILRFKFDDDAVRTALQVQPDADDPTAGTFALTVVPPHGGAAGRRPRDVVFVLDRSGSMGGWKMLAARRAIGRMVYTLTAADRFAVLAFDFAVEAHPASGLTPAGDRQRFRAIEFLATVDARGGTELATPLQQALGLLTDAGRDRVLVLVTDGQVGNEDQILKSLADRLKGIRIFTLGIDQAVNDAFLKRLAGLGGGYTELVESEDRLDAVMDKVHRRIGAPVLTGLKIEPAGLTFEPGTLVPERLPDLFPGAPLVVLGRCTIRDGGGISIQATDDAGRPWSVTVRGERGEVLAPVWAKGHVRELEDRFATGRGDRSALEKRIVAAALKHNVLCRFTAFVAVDVKEVVNEGGQMTRVTQPVEPAAGWKMLHTEDAEALTLGGALPAAASLAQPPSGMYRMRGYMPPPPAAAPPAAAPADDLDEAPRKRKMAAPTARSRQSSAPEKLAKAIFGSIFGGSDRSSSVPPGGPDLSAYRQRAGELLKDLEVAADRPRGLGVLARRLEELLDDLKSIGTADADRQPLADLLTELRGFLAKPTPTAAEVTAMGARSQEVLSAFAGTGGGRRTAFWK